LDDRDPSSSTKTGALIAVTVVIIIAGLIVGFIQWTNRHIYCSAASGTSLYETPRSLNQHDPDDLYIRIQQPTKALYQRETSVHCQPDTNTNSGTSIVIYSHYDI
ncbi:hypothetical protein Q5P01_000279, partial [Channa striata]